MSEVQPVPSLNLGPEDVHLYKGIRERVKQFVRELWQDGKISHNWQPGDEELFVRIVWEYCKAEQVDDEPITADTLAADGWTIDPLHHATLILDEYSYNKLVRWPNGDIWMHSGDHSMPVADIETVSTVQELRTLARLIGGPRD